MIKKSQTISEHFHSTEFKCPCCGDIKISEKLVDAMEKLFDKLNASKCLVSSGYRCEDEELRLAGFVAQHNKGYAADCIYYDKQNKPIPAVIVVCVAFDLGVFKGIARIDANYVHLDVRTNGYYCGDEMRGNSSYWTNPREYFNVSDDDINKYIGNSNNIFNDDFPKGDYETLYNMYVRTGAGTNYSIKLVKYLTVDGKNNALDKNENALAVYKKGTIFTALDIVKKNNAVWAKTPSGYVSIKGESGTLYSKKL